MGDVPPLSGAQEALVAVAAALATRDERTISAALHVAGGVCAPVTVDEVILQSHLFIGFPDALNALISWRRISGPAAAADEAEDPRLWDERGPAVCERVYGVNYPKLRANVGALHPDFDRWMVVGGYGRVIGRAGLDLVTRELCIAALLAVWNVPRQLHSHLRGALNVGASRAAVERALAIACGLLNPLEAEGVQALWAEVARKR